MTARAHVAIDAGQTGVKIRLRRRGSSDIEDVRPGIRTDAPLIPQLAAIVQQVQEQSGHEVEAVSLGVSGLTTRDSDAAALLALLSGRGTERVMLAHDSVTSYLGSLGDRRGAVIAAGTGVVTLGVGRSRVARVDGWGNIMGDAGSAHWIGREGLDAAMRAHDGRGAPTALVDAMRERWADVESAYIELQSAPDRVRQVAAFAEHVTALTDTDSTAAQIALRAARELATSVVAALTRISESDDDGVEEVSAIGGVFRSEPIRSRFEELVCEARPRARMRTSCGSGLDGAALLPDLPAQHPLRAQISEAVAAV